MVKQIKRENVQFRSISDLKGYSDATVTNIAENPSLTDTTQYESISDLLKRMVRNGETFNKNIDGYDEQLHPEDMQDFELADVEPTLYNKIEDKTTQQIQQLKKQKEEGKPSEKGGSGSFIKQATDNDEEKNPSTEKKQNENL